MDKVRKENWLERMDYQRLFSDWAKNYFAELSIKKYMPEKQANGELGSSMAHLFLNVVEAARNHRHLLNLVA
jgi:hypothetical protein